MSYLLDRWHFTLGRGMQHSTKEFKILVLFRKLEPINCRALLETLSCRSGKLMFQVTSVSVSLEAEWRSIRDNLRNFFLSPPAEILSFFPQLREAI
jgi:hypothetical protein